MDVVDIVIAFGAIALVAIATARRDARIAVSFSWKTLGMFALYMGYCVLSILIVFQVTQGAPAGSLKAVFGALFVLAWIGFGMLCLIRFVPRLKEPPKLLTQPFGPLGLGCLAVGLAALAALVADF